MTYCLNYVNHKLISAKNNFLLRGSRGFFLMPIILLKFSPLLVYFNCHPPALPALPLSASQPIDFPPEK